MCRKELGAEACLINGASIMGKKDYAVFSYTNEDGVEVVRCSKVCSKVCETLHSAEMPSADVQCAKKRKKSV